LFQNGKERGYTIANLIRNDPLLWALCWPGTFAYNSNLILQYIWFRRVLKAKNEEIKRLADREQLLNNRVIFMISEEIGFKKRAK